MSKEKINPATERAFAEAHGVREALADALQAANNSIKARPSVLSLAQLKREIQRERRANKPLNLWG